MGYLFVQPSINRASQTHPLCPTYKTSCRSVYLGADAVREEDGLSTPDVLEADLEALGLAALVGVPLLLKSGVASVFHILLLYPGKDA